jgi:hypothetical protein
MSSIVDTSEPATITETTKRVTHGKAYVPNANSRDEQYLDRLEGGKADFASQAQKKRASESLFQESLPRMASETVVPQQAGAAKSKKARIGSVSPRPHTTAPKSGVGTLESGQPHEAKSRSNPATVPIVVSAQVAARPHHPRLKLK